tara:strand:+ start:23664 stop:24902 length:1239 start_codon:yes stop_codon:yes gene_type:complete
MSRCIKNTSACFVVVFLVTLSINAQETVSDFLLTAFEDRSLLAYDAQTKFLKPSNYRIPIIDELEIRAGNDEQTYEDLQYAFRVRPSNPWKIRRNNALFNATKKELSIRRQIEFKENLSERYELLATYYFEKKLFDLISQQQLLASKKASIFQNNMESDLFDARDFAEAKLDQIEGLESMDEALVQWNQTQQRVYTILGTSTFNWSSFDLISVEHIDSVSSIIVNSALSSVELELITQRIEVARQEVRLEKADFDIGYVQAEYFPFTNRDTEIGYSIGFTIPIFRNNRPQIAERKLDEIELKNEFKSEEHQDSVKKILEYEHLKNLLLHHKMILEKVDEIDLESLASNLARIEDYDPIAILDLEEGILKLDEILLKSEKRVIEQYLEFLFTFDVIIDQPLINYLSDSLEYLQ